MNRLTKVNIFVICIFSLFVVSIFCHSKTNMIENFTPEEAMRQNAEQNIKASIINTEIENRVKYEIQNLDNKLKSKTNLLGFCSIFETNQDIETKKTTIQNDLKYLLDEIQKTESDNNYVYNIEITNLESSENQNNIDYSYTIKERKDNNIPHKTSFTTGDLNSILKKYLNNKFSLQIEEKDFSHLIKKDELHNVMKVCSSQNNRRTLSNSICNPNNVENEIEEFQFPRFMDLFIKRTIKKNGNTEDENSQPFYLDQDVVDKQFKITMFGDFEQTNCGDFTLDISIMQNSWLNNKYEELYGDTNKRDMPYIKKEYTFHSCSNSIPSKLQEIINNPDNGVDSQIITKLLDACDVADSQLFSNNTKLYIKVSTEKLDETNIRYALGLQEKTKFFLSNGKYVYYDFYTLKTYDNIENLYTLTIYRRSNCHYIPPKALSFDNQKGSRAHGHNIDSTES